MPRDHERVKGPWKVACDGEREVVAPQFGCKSYACAIQDCLEKYTYDQRQCAREVHDLIECCRQLAKPHGSVHCQGFMRQIQAKDTEEQQRATER